MGRTSAPSRRDHGQDPAHDCGDGGAHERRQGDNSALTSTGSEPLLRAARPPAASLLGRRRRITKRRFLERGTRTHLGVTRSRGLSRGIAGVLASGDGCRPSSSCPNSVIRLGCHPRRLLLGDQRVRGRSSRPATDAPFCSADRHTSSGSMMPMSIMLPKRPSSASNPSSTPRLATWADLLPGIAGVGGDQIARAR